VKHRLLVVDDDEAIRDSLAEALAQPARDLRVAEDASAALAMLEEWRPDVILSDVRMTWTAWSCSPSWPSASRLPPSS
jgi:CheY-like chemotaxis protein